MIRWCIPFLFACMLLPAQKRDRWVDSLLNTDPKLSSVIHQPDKYKLQIIYTRIDRNAQGVPSFQTSTWHADSMKYFYCASMVKLPCSILALEKLNDLNVPGLTKESYLLTDSANACQRSVSSDSSAVSGYPSLAQYIRKMLLVSDNFAYGRVYEFLNPDYIYDRMHQLGWPSARIVHRFDGGCRGTENLHTNPIRFLNAQLEVIYQQPAHTSARTYTNPLGTVTVGKAYYGGSRWMIKQPKDFTNMNVLSLYTIHDVLKRLVFHTYTPDKQQYHIGQEDWKFLMTYLGMYPRESVSPVYNPRWYHDSYKKYLLYGDSKQPITDTNIRIFNIVGQSYGFMADCAYIVDAKNGVEFMLSAVVYANADEVINDGKYEYTTVALPYLAELGRLFYRYELQRPKAYMPNLAPLLDLEHPTAN